LSGWRWVGLPDVSSFAELTPNSSPIHRRFIVICINVLASEGFGLLLGQLDRGIGGAALKRIIAVITFSIILVALVAETGFAQDPDPPEPVESFALDFFTWLMTDPPDWVSGGLFAVSGFFGALATAYTLIGGVMPATRQVKPESTRSPHGLRGSRNDWMPW
jgi:hypothetical protein